MTKNFIANSFECFQYAPGMILNQSSVFHDQYSVTQTYIKNSLFPVAMSYLCDTALKHTSQK